MLILGIESSCDETAFALLDCSKKHPSVRAEVISSQTEIHKEYGGVVPELAARAHLKNLPLLLDKVLRDGECSLADVDLLAVTQGPGLKGCLLMGVEYAKGLSLGKDIPLVGVNHIEGHVLAPMLDNPELTFPFLCLVVSGGHTEIHEVHGVGDYRLIARTTDDAAGEAFDKSAALIGLPYPGGPKLAKLADEFVGKPRFELPKVMREAEGFSFSGLKTAISLLIKREQEGIRTDRALLTELCAAIQNSIVDALCHKLEQAKERTGMTQVAITGGVSANQALSRRVRELGFDGVYLPSKLHCMDNAAMIAFAGWKRRQASLESESLASVFPRWPIETAQSEVQV